MADCSDIDIPEIVPVMTLKDTVLFPHAIMPLFIFEPRYRQMLCDSLHSHRLFAVFNEIQGEPEADYEERPAKMGTLGVIRAAHKNPDGTSNLALQGLVRIRLLEVVRESPYRLIRIEPCADEENSEDHLSDARNRAKIIDLLKDQPDLTNGLPEEYMQFLYSLHQPSSFLDVAIHSICQCPDVKQRLLETLSIGERFKGFTDFLLGEQKRLELYSELQGSTQDSEIHLN